MASLTPKDTPAGTADPFGPDRAVIEALLRSSAQPSIFLEPWWASSWLTALGIGCAPSVIRLLDGDDLVGLAAISSNGTELELAGDPDLFDYRDIAVANGREEQVSGALLDHLCAGDSPHSDWRTLSLPSVRDGSVTAEALTGAAIARGMDVERAEDGVAPAAALPGSWDEFLAALPKKHRHELRRKMRRLEASGDVRTLTVSEPAGLEQHVDRFLGLMESTNEMKAAFLTDERRMFFHLIASEAAARGALRLSFLEIDGRLAATCMVFDYGGEYMLYNSGYDPEMSSLSVGLISKALAIREAIGAGRRTFDFLKGAERYKYGLGGSDRPIHRIVITRGG